MSENEIPLYDTLWATIQQSCSVVCCCAPIYKSLVPSMDLYSRVKSFASRIFGRCSGSRFQLKEEDKEQLPLDSFQANASSWDQNPAYRAHKTTYTGTVEYV